MRSVGRDVVTRSDRAARKNACGRPRRSLNPCRLARDVGDRRGTPLASPAVIPGVGWLTTSNGREPAPADARKRAPGGRPRRRRPGRRGQAPRPRDRRPHGRRSAPSRAYAMAALSAPRPGFHRPVPLGDPRSSILGDSTARIFPEMPPETASEPRRGSGQVSVPVVRTARYSAHCSIRTRRRSKRSERA